MAATPHSSCNLSDVISIAHPLIDSICEITKPTMLQPLRLQPVALPIPCAAPRPKPSPTAASVLTRVRQRPVCRPRKSPDCREPCFRFVLLRERILPLFL